MTTRWLAAVDDDLDHPAAPPIAVLATVIYERATTPIVGAVCPRWLRWEPSDVAWMGAPFAVIGLGLPEGLMRLYWATLLAVGVYAALRWAQIVAAVVAMRRRRCLQIVALVAGEMRTANPPLACDVVRSGHWNTTIESAVLASLERHVRRTPGDKGCP